MKFYTLIANICRFGSSKKYVIGETLKENEEKQQNIKKKMEETRANESLSQSEKDNRLEQLNCYLKCNEKYYNNLKEKGLHLHKGGKIIINEELKQINKLVVMDQYAINTLREEPNNSLSGVIKGKEDKEENKVKKEDKNYTLESVGNYAKEFAQEIKGEPMDFIDEERLQER